LDNRTWKDAKQYGADKSRSYQDVSAGKNTIYETDSIRHEQQPKFCSPFAALKTLSEAAAVLESAYNAALQAGPMPRRNQHHGTEERHAGLLLMQEASYVQSSSGGDKAKIESAGFDVRDTPTPIASCLRRRNRRLPQVNILAL